MCEIVRPVVGCPSSFWKKKVVEDTRAHELGVIKEIDTGRDLCLDCFRHFELLDALQEGVIDLSGTEYYRFYKNRGFEPDKFRNKVRHIINLSNSIRASGCKVPPLLLPEGIRLDGSHRLAIASVVGVKKVKVRIISLEEVFYGDTATVKNIRREIEEIRRRKIKDAQEKGVI